MNPIPTTTYWIGQEDMPLSEDQKAKLLLSGNSCDNCYFGGKSGGCGSTKRKEHYEVLSSMKNNGLVIKYHNLPRAADFICGWWEANDK